MEFHFNKDLVRRSNLSVAMIVANGVKGDSRVLKTAQTVRKLGFKVTIYGLNGRNEIGSIEGYPFGVTLIPNPKFAMLNSGDWPSEKKDLDFGIFTDHITKSLMKIFETSPPDIIHTHDMIGMAIGGNLVDAYASRRLPWIHDIHEFVRGLTDIPEKHRLFFELIERKYIKKPDQLSVVSPTLAKILVNEYQLQVEPHLVLNAPRRSDFDPNFTRDIRSACGLPADIPLAVYSGNVKPVRGVNTLLDAMQIMHELHVAVVSQSTGELNALRSRAAEMKVQDRLHIHPYVPFMNVTSFLRTATVGVHPISRYPNAEIALPNKLFEYLHSGIPVVVSDNPTMAVFVREHDCGDVFRVGDAGHLAECLHGVVARIDQEPSWKARLSDLADRFSWEGQEVQIAQAYDRLSASLLGSVADTAPEADLDAKRAVIHLPGAAAGQPNAFKKALRGRGWKADSLIVGDHKFNYEADIRLDSIKAEGEKTFQHLSPLIKNYDVFHFHARPLFFWRNSRHFTGIDLLLLKLAGKKVFFHFRGSECRVRRIFAQASPYNYADENPDGMFDQYPEDVQKSFRNLVFGICDKVFATDPELQSYIPNTVIVPRALDLNDWHTVPYVDAPIVKIVHAPSRKSVKGTTAIIEAVKRLLEEGYAIEFTLVENVPHDEAKKLYCSADIVVDQLRIGWYGVLAVEAMALGKAVVSYVRDDIKHYLPYPFPFAIANPENIYDVLKYLLSNRNEIRILGQRGRTFVEEHHNAHRIAETLEIIYRDAERSSDPSAAWTYLSEQLSREIKFNVAKNIAFQVKGGAKKKLKLKAPKKQTTIARLQKQFRYFNRGNIRLFITVAKRDGMASAAEKAFRIIFNRNL